ncbi:MAG: hypothetical protein JWP85_527 [Rhodoglobus sp.]|nr:hypothetical protein [Rhodoglobus sp.]
MATTWSDYAAAYVLSTTTCPRCGCRLVDDGQCRDCGASIDAELGSELWDASTQVADAIKARQEIIDRIPTRVHPASAPALSVAPPPAILPPPRVDEDASSFSVQSVLAVAGAGLLGVAAIVFTFLNPDLTNFGTRTAIIGGTTALFLAGAWLLARKGLQFSAEAIGGLGMVFVALDVWALSELAPTGVSAWLLIAIATLASSTIVIAIAAVARVRSWLWTGLLGVVAAPVFFAYAIAQPWVDVIGYVMAGFIALGLHEVAHRLESRFGGSLRVEHVTLSALQVVSVIFALGLLPRVVFPDATANAPGAAAVIAALAILAALAARTGLPRFWSYSAGVLFVSAAAVLSVALRPEGPWILAIVPLAGALALVAVTAAPSLPGVRRELIAGGAWTVSLFAAVPAFGLALIRLSSPVGFSFEPGFGLASTVGVAAAAGGSWGLSRAIRRWRGKPALPDAALATALWLGVVALLTLALWAGLPRTTQTVITLAVAVGLSAVVVWAHPIRAWRPLLRSPLAIGAHLALVYAVAVSWSDPSITVVAGMGVVAALVLVARTVPAGVRPLHVGAAYAYALIVFTTFLDRAGVETMAMLCLTTSLAALGALAATLIRQVKAPAWYAILTVTAVPFAIGVISVIMVRSGWTALSTGVTFALALTLVLTNRPGLNRIVRAGAAAILVPALAVVVICLGAQVLAISASPITLPIIAGIVALALPVTGHLERVLVRRGIADAHARASRIWIEISCLITAAIAVVLALVRVAAGFETSFLVLSILGIGSAAAALVTRRRYAWGVSGASWTGALWSFLALIGVDVLEPYVLPPALVAALLGAVLVWRGLPGIGFYAAGLAAAVLPSLGVLATFGHRADGAGELRTWLLLAGAFVLTAVGGLLSSPEAQSGLEKLRRLRKPTLVVAMLAAAGGAVQAVRLGLSLDPAGVPNHDLMFPVLAWSGIAALVAVAAGRALGRGRWIFMPAVVYLVAGPIVAIRPGWFSIFTLLALTLALLVLMVVTAARARTREVTLPPVWFTFALALATAIAGWSERELRVEAFSLPLGLALVATGVIAMRSVHPAPNLNSWPIGFTGSWRLLAPGILVTLGPSMLATLTDPRTERAILVIGLALVAILIGSLRQLGAPFILGIIALPIENVLVFTVQLGRSIGAAPWWITLATAGAVLLVIAVTYERKSAASRGVGARLRDLA